MEISLRFICDCHGGALDVEDPARFGNFSHNFTLIDSSRCRKEAYFSGLQACSLDLTANASHCLIRRHEVWMADQYNRVTGSFLVLGPLMLVLGFGLAVKVITIVGWMGTYAIIQIFLYG